MPSRPRRIVFHIIMFLVVLVVVTAVSIWLGLGPVVHSQTALSAGISN
jgi:hypothetical protein